MSKSDDSDLSRINLTDDKDKILNKIKKQKQIHTQFQKMLRI